MTEKQSFLKTFKTKKTIIVLGDNESGKTNILQKYTKNKFDEGYKTTWGANFYRKEVIVNENNLPEEDSKQTSVLLNLWDSSGLESTKQVIPTNLYKNSDAFLICCSYDNLPSLMNVKQWIIHIKKLLNSAINVSNVESTLANANNQTEIIRESKPIPIFILCNKYDIPTKLRKFGSEEIHSQLKEISASKEFDIKIYHQISAKDNFNIDYIFNKLVTILTGYSLKLNKKLYLSTQPSISDTRRNEVSFNIDIHNKTFVLKSGRVSLADNKCKSNCCK